jgi:hypothetical protein
VAKYCVCVLWLGILCVSSVAGAMPPSESLLPSTTKGYLSVPDVETLRAQWNATQLGHLVNDPVMKPFIEDLKDQIKDKLSATRIRLGLTLDDLDDLYGGELCLAVIQPENDVEQHAIALLLDVTGHREQAEAMLAKVSRNLLAQGATRRVEQVGSVDIAVFTMPRAQPDSPEVHAWMVLYQDMLIATDHGGVCAHLVRRVKGEGGETLEDRAAFRATMERCAREAGDMRPQLRWFVDPFGYAQVTRAAAGGRKKRGVDLLRVLPRQGFDALQGVGGHIFIATGDQEFLHRTMVYAPAVPRAADSAVTDRYNLAARMLDFPNTDDLQPQGWVARDLGSYLTFNWKMIEAFEYSKTLVNEILGASKEKIRTCWKKSSSAWRKTRTALKWTCART